MILETAVICLALNIHYEAGSDPLAGQLAVALATLNRAKHRPERVCNVVFAPGQFEWTAAIPPGPSRRQMVALKSTARQAFETPDFTGGAVNFCHVDYRCSWQGSMVYLGTWGSHNFFKPKGKR